MGWSSGCFQRGFNETEGISLDVHRTTPQTMVLDKKKRKSYTQTSISFCFCTAHEMSPAASLLPPQLDLFCGHSFPAAGTVPSSCGLETLLLSLQWETVTITIFKQIQLLADNRQSVLFVLKLNV